MKNTKNLILVQMNHHICKYAQLTKWKYFKLHVPTKSGKKEVGGPLLFGTRVCRILGWVEGRVALDGVSLGVQLVVF